MSSSSHSPSGSTATATITVSSETAGSLNTYDSDKDCLEFTDGVTINEKTVLTGPKPVYPVSLRCLRDLLKGPTINVFVGQKPNLDLVFPISKALLAYFCPALRTALQNRSANNYVALRNADKKAVSWVLRWMLSGGLDKTYVNAPVMGDLTECLSKRLQVVVELGIQGILQHNIYEELKQLVLKGAVNAHQLSWMFAVESPSHAKALGKNLSFFVVDAILNGTMTTIIPSVRSNAIFAAEVGAALVARKGRLYAKQHHNWEPVSIFQLDFIYAFTGKGHEIRNMVVHDLIRLHYWQCVPNEQIYITYAERNVNFNDDWERASLEKHEYRAKKLRERAGTTVGQQLTATANGPEHKPQRKSTFKNKKNHTHPATAQKAVKGPPENLNAHHDTTSQADNSLPQSTTPRHRTRKNAKRSGLYLKPGSITPSIANPASETLSATAPRKDVNEGRKDIEATTSKAEQAKTPRSCSPPATPRPAQRLESDVVLRLNTDGEVERER